jgi:hypothetical protein
MLREENLGPRGSCRMMLFYFFRVTKVLPQWPRCPVTAPQASRRRSQFPLQMLQIATDASLGESNTPMESVSIYSKKPPAAQTLPEKAAMKKMRKRGGDQN